MVAWHSALRNAYWMSVILFICVHLNFSRCPVPPFYNQNLHVMYERILRAKLQMPSYLSPSAQSLLSGLLERNPRFRLGFGWSLVSILFSLMSLLLQLLTLKRSKHIHSLHPSIGKSCCRDLCNHHSVLHHQAKVNSTRPTSMTSSSRRLQKTLLSKPHHFRIRFYSKTFPTAHRARSANDAKMRPQSSHN